MQRGAFAIIDALGFKGVWRRSPSDDVIATLRGQRELAEKFVAAQGRWTSLLAPEGIEASVTSAVFSDTCMLAVPLRADSTAHDWYPIVTAAAVVGRIIRGGLNLPVPLAHRGCISFGEFEMVDGSFVVGPAIDEAAELEKAAEAAVVWLTPSAKHILDERSAAGHEDPFTTLVPNYPVPTKAGVYRTYVLDPFLEARGEPERIRALEAREF